jgi:mRNA interferase HicA
MNSDQFERWLKNRDIVIQTKSGTGHKVAINPANGKKSDIPTHGGRKQLGTGIIRKILKELGLD